MHTAESFEPGRPLRAGFAHTVIAHQRTVRLAQVPGVFYFSIGVVLTIPIKTHAAAVEMRRARGGALGPVLTTFVVSIVAALLVVVVSLLIARGMAVFCGGKVGREA
jgi:hypothetical protein